MNVDKIPAELQKYRILELKPNIIAVYFLYMNNELVYIGKSTNLVVRIGRHINNKLKFNRVYYLECDKNDLNNAEMMFINKFTPPLNKQGNQYNLWQGRLNRIKLREEND